MSNCGRCKFFRRIEVMQASGHCRSRPPFVVSGGFAQGQPQALTYWPTVPDTEWCGDWTERPRAVSTAGIDLAKVDASDIEGSA